MPNHGRSGRCLTCKRRRVRCDEVRPACSPCRRLGLDCGGYARNYTFRDENHKYISTATRKTSKQQTATVDPLVVAREPSRSLLTRDDVAVPFFLVQYADMGRRLAAARGFYEKLIPVYTSQPHDSPLALAVSAVASRVFSFWRHEDEVHEGRFTAPYTEAVASLRLALQRSDDRRRIATVLAILTLHLYESINAVYHARQAMPAHHHGALSLVPIAEVNGLDDSTSAYVKSFVLHTEISSAMRQKRLIHPNAYSYMRNPNASSPMPDNFSSTLDSIGASIAELQADYVRTLSQHQLSRPSLEQMCKAWIVDASEIDQLLQAWVRDLPYHWRPLRLQSGKDFDPSITAYRSACDIYPSCQVATLWNLWRFHRLLLLKITMVATHILSLPPHECVQHGLLASTTVEDTAQVEAIQGLVDNICHSLPFYLGNRTKQSSLCDFSDPGILFPSYHILASGNVSLAAGDQDCHDVALSRDEHRRHILAYGAWHAVSPLSNLMTLVSDEYGGHLVASCLRPGQQEWIRQQFLRVSTLVRLPAAGASGSQERPCPSLLPVYVKSTDGAAESLAKQVRKGAIFMSGP